MARRRILVLGGALAGPTAAARARETDEEARITILTREARVAYAAAGLPYHLSGEVRSLEALDRERAEFFRRVYRIDVWAGCEATAIDPFRRVLEVRRKGGVRRLPYDALIFALGARARAPEPALTGDNVNTLRTLDHVLRLEEELRRGRRRVAVIGAGLHGVAVVDGLVRGGAEVTLIERAPRILPQFGIQAARLAHEALERRCEVIPGATVVDATARRGRIRSLRLSTDRDVPVDFVVLTAGIAPATELLARVGAHLAPDGSAYVTERAETSLAGIYACGVCVSVPHLWSGLHLWSAQGAVADKTAQVAGANAAGGDARLAPVAGTMIRRVLDWTVARTGLTEREARAHVGADFQMTTVHAPSHDPYFPDAHPVLVQLFWDRASGRVLGAEVAGRSGVDKRIDVVAAALAGGLTVEDLARTDFAYAPPYGSQRDPVNVAATAAACERAGLVRFVTPEELHERLADTLVVDVRARADAREGGIPRARRLPLEELRGRFRTLDRRRAIATYCDTGRRGYLAARILVQKGFRDVVNLEGGFRSWRLSGLPVQASRRRKNGRKE